MWRAFLILKRTIGIHRLATRSGSPVARLGRRLYSVAFVVLVVAASSSSWSAARETFQPLAATSGLSSQVIVALTVDRHGFIWAGSRDGLYRYDGYRATRYAPDSADPHSISDLDIRTIYEDRAGHIWIATNTAGLNRFEPESEGFTRYRHDSSDPASLSYDSVYGMSDGPQGDLWVATQVGLNRLDRSTQRFTRYRHDPERPGSLSGDYTFVLLLDRSDALWIGTVGGGLNRWEPETETFTHFDLSELAAEGGRVDLNDVFSLCEDDDGTLWVGTRVGLVRVSPGRDRFTVHRLSSSGSAEPLITSILRATDGRLWLATAGDGLIGLDPRTGVSRRLGSEGVASGLPEETLLSLAVVGDALLVGSWGRGVFLGRPGDSPFLLLGSGDDPAALRNETVTAVVETDTVGRPWVGTFGGGPQRVDVEAGTAARLPGEEIDLWSIGVLSLARTGDGRLYAGTVDGLWELSGAGEPVRLHRHAPGEEGTLGLGYVTCLLPALDDALWVGVGGSGLYRLEAGADRFSARRHEPQSPSSLSGDYITALLDEPGGSLWVGTRSAGLNLCSRRPWSCRRFFDEAGPAGSMRHHSITSLFRDDRQRVWVGTDGGGIYEVVRDADGTPSSFRQWGGGDGLVSDSVMSVLGDEDGWLWLSTRDGLARLQPDRGVVVSHVAETGLPVTHFSKNAAAADERYLYFGAIGGLLSVPRGLPASDFVPAPTRLTAIKAFGPSSPPDAAAWNLESYAVPYGSGLSVEFAVLDFAESPHEYEYRLDPKEEWTRLGPRREVTFFGLAPGDYRFEVRGRDVRGQWSEASPLALTIVPPYWMTGWFRLLAALTVGLGAFAAHAYRLRSLRRHNRELIRLRDERERAYQGLSRLTSRLEAAKEEERRHISRELHDELGQNLTAAKINLEMLKRESGGRGPSERVSNAVEMVEAMIRQVRSISLNLRPPLLDEAGLVAALEHYLHTVSERTGVPITLEVAGGFPTHSEKVETVLFRVIQEAVSNSLRHSDASRVRIELGAVDGVVCVRAEDDGRGFDVADVDRKAQSGDHLGLLGMRERLRDVGGSVELYSAPGDGTRLEARVPV